MTAIEQFAGFIAQRRPVSDEVREAVRLHVIDTVAALIAGMATAEGQALVRYRAASTSSTDVPRDLMSLCALARPRLRHRAASV